MYDLAFAGDLVNFATALGASCGAPPEELAFLHPLSVRVAYIVHLDNVLKYCSACESPIKTTDFNFLFEL